MSRNFSLSLSFLHFVIQLCSSVRSVQDLGTEGRWFCLRLGKYSFRESLIHIATVTKSIPLSPRSNISKVAMWESSQWLERINGYKKLQESMDMCTGREGITRIMLKNDVKHQSTNRSIDRSVDRWIDQSIMIQPIVWENYILLWRRMSGGTIFLFGFEKCLWRQSYCWLGSGLVRPLKSFRPGLVSPMRLYGTLLADKWNLKILIFSI